jgi:hypothetical protein
VVIFNTDKRSLVQGNCNPVVMGLGDFKYVTGYDEIRDELDRLFADGGPKCVSEPMAPFELANSRGRQISEYLATKRPIFDLTELLIELFGDSNVKVQKTGT